MTVLATFYISSPCLWRIKAKKYTERNKKRQTCEILVEKCEKKLIFVPF